MFSYEVNLKTLGVSVKHADACELD